MVSILALTSIGAERNKSFYLSTCHSETPSDSIEEEFSHLFSPDGEVTNELERSNSETPAPPPSTFQSLWSDVAFFPPLVELSLPRFNLCSLSILGIAWTSARRIRNNRVHARPACFSRESGLKREGERRKKIKGVNFYIISAFNAIISHDINMYPARWNQNSTSVFRNTRNFATHRTASAKDSIIPVESSYNCYIALYTQHTRLYSLSKSTFINSSPRKLVSSVITNEILCANDILPFFLFLSLFLSSFFSLSLSLSLTCSLSFASIKFQSNQGESNRSRTRFHLEATKACIDTPLSNRCNASSLCGRQHKKSHRHSSFGPLFVEPESRCPADTISFRDRYRDDVVTTWRGPLDWKTLTN